MYIVFLKITTFLWIILILHPGYINLYPETVTVKPMRPGGPGPGAEKNKYPKIITVIISLHYNEAN